MTGTGGDGRQHRCRHRDHERTRRGHHEQRHRLQEGRRERVAQQEQHCERATGDPQHANDIDRLVAIEHALRRGPLLPRIAHEIDHLGEHGLIGATIDPDLEIPVEVHRPRHHRIARIARNRHGLAGDCGLIHRRPPVRHRPVHGYAITRTDDGDHPHVDVVDRQCALGAVRILDRHRLRPQIHQCANRGFRPAERELLEHVPEREQKQQHSAFPKGLHGVGPGGGDQHQQIDVQRAVSQRANRGP